MARSMFRYEDMKSNGLSSKAARHSSSQQVAAFQASDGATGSEFILCAVVVSCQSSGQLGCDPSLGTKATRVQTRSVSRQGSSEREERDSTGTPSASTRRNSHSKSQEWKTKSPDGTKSDCLQFEESRATWKKIAARMETNMRNAVKR